MQTCKSRAFANFNIRANGISPDEVPLFLAPVRKIIEIFTTLVRKKYEWICSAGETGLILNVIFLISNVTPSTLQIQSYFFRTKVVKSLIILRTGAKKSSTSSRK